MKVVSYTIIGLIVFSILFFSQSVDDVSGFASRSLRSIPTSRMSCTDSDGGIN